MRGLTDAEVERFQFDGVLFPLPALSPGETAAFRAAYEDLRGRLGTPPPPQHLAQTHLSFRWACDLATHPAILDAVEQLIGPDFVVHSSTIFDKPAQQARFVSWHQDGFRWQLDPPDLVSAWIAFTESSTENGCLRVIPGSHRERLPHALTAIDAKNLLTSGLETTVEVDETRAVDVVLPPGMMSLHQVNVVHGSKANHSHKDRIGFAIRYAATRVKQIMPHHGVLLARGKDAHGHFALARPPSDDSTDAALTAHLRIVDSVQRLREAASRVD